MAAIAMFNASQLNTFHQTPNMRTRNNSGGSTGSNSSYDSSSSSELASPILQASDLQTIANLLSCGGSSTAARPVQQQPPPPQTQAGMQQLINSQFAMQQQQQQQLVAAAASNGQQIQPEQLKTIGGTTRYKTELCRSYTETGFCKYGDKCQFAHGNFEIKAMPRHPKYKSDLCRTFHTTGLCPYGPRCHFIHSEDESKLTEINLMKQQAAARQATQQMLQQASRLRAQQQALQAQMQALMISQVHLQIAQKQLKPGSTPPTTPVTPVQQSPIMPQQSKPAYCSQMSVPVLPNMTTVPTAHQVCERSVSMSAYSNNNHSRVNMGSTVDTPPITPPCGSPTFDSPCSDNVFTDAIIPSPTSKVVLPPPGFAPRCSTTSSVCSSISSEMEKPKSALNLDFYQSNLLNSLNAGEFDCKMSEVVSRLHSVDLDSVSSFEMYTPSASPDSMVHSPMESPRSGSSIGSRLPVFSQFA